ncbi:eukaryotic translation initiation factor 3 subunit M-like isoform X2 [Cucumis melo var. makuwa]|uniref:Eukaryotic translation initiation factor 3 subunit M-like isoform X2 n=2 Tax=Cucumis melo TaxID=3656 RepID=A0A5A7UE08_CUCMM|nr:eukaryotic translation initiation factor 3 subunit M-like isoform X2 [Cucumis melo var. makuwa]
MALRHNERKRGGWKWEPLFSHSTKLEPIEEVTIKGLIGCRSVFSSDTRGTGFMHLTFLSSFSSDVGMYSLSYGGDYITHGSNTRHGHCDLLDMPAVGQLEKDAKYSLVYQLLKIFLTQRLDAYMEFQAANSSLLKSYGLVHEDCIAKMRLLSLVDLGSNESARIPYALIKGVTCVLLVLQINDDEVELWVVKAITSKLIDCKMDQMNEVVIVSRY